MAKIPNPTFKGTAFIMRCDLCGSTEDVSPGEPVEKSISIPTVGYRTGLVVEDIGRDLCSCCRDRQKNFALCGETERGSGKWTVKAIYPDEGSAVKASVGFPGLVKIEPLTLCPSCSQKHLPWEGCPPRWDR